jgi:hypothetical protein
MRATTTFRRKQFSACLPDIGRADQRAKSGARVREFERPKAHFARKTPRDDSTSWNPGNYLGRNDYGRVLGERVSAHATPGRARVSSGAPIPQRPSDEFRRSRASDGRERRAARARANV